MIDFAYEAIHSGPKLRFVSTGAAIYRNAGDGAKKNSCRVADNSLEGRARMAYGMGLALIVSTPCCKPELHW